MGAVGVRALTEADKLKIFRIATRSFARNHAKEIKCGMTDRALEAALESSLGVFGGSGGPDKLSVSFAGAGLRIWGGWHTVNHVQEKPLFSGKKTVATAREVHAIQNPEIKQMQLF